MKKSTIATLCFALVLTWEHQAHAYLDGNSGSIIIQALVGAVLGMLVFVKMYWHAFLIKIGVKKVVDDDDDDDDETTHVETEANVESD